MSDFDPDKYLQEGSSAGGSADAFDPDKYLSDTRDVSGWESAARGVAQGASLGFADEIAGAAESLFTDKTYEQARDESRANFKRAKEVNPNAYLAGEFGGGAATMLVPGMAAAKSLRAAAATGAALGGTAGLGASEGETIDELAKDTLMGVGIGAGGGTVGYGVAKGIEKAAPIVGDKLSKFAEKRAFKALGPTKAATEKAQARGIDSSIGRDLLDADVIKPFRSKENMLDRVSGLVDDSANQLDDTLGKVSQLQSGADDATWLRLEESKFTPRKAAEQLKSQIRQDYSQLPDEVLQPRFDQVDQWLSKPGRMNAKDAQAFKTQMQKFIKDGSYYKDNPGASQETLMGVRRAIKEGIENNADTAAEVLGEAGGQVKNINRTLGNRLEAEDILSDRVARDATNRTVSLTDYLAMVAGAATDPTAAYGAAKGAVAAGANKLARETGSATMAYGADRVAKFLLQQPRMARLAQQNLKAFKALAADIARRFPQEAPKRIADQDEKSPIASQPMEPDQMRQDFIDGN